MYDVRIMNELRKVHAGFTLLELLVSMSILAIVGILLTQVFVTVIRTNTKNEVTKEVKQNGYLAFSVMTRMLQNALDVTSDCVSTGSTAPMITITNPDGGATTFECRSDSGVLRISSTSGTPSYLTSPGVTLTGADCTAGLAFTCTTLSTNKKSVNIVFSLAQKGTPPDRYDQASEAFQTTVTLRNQ